MTDQATATETAASAVDLLQRPDWKPESLASIRRIVFSNRGQFDSLKGWLNGQPAGELRKGLGWFVIGRYRDAAAILEQHPNQAGVPAVLAECYTCTGQAQKALDVVASPQTAAEAGARARALLRQASQKGASRNGGALDPIDELLGSPGLLEGTAWVPFLAGWKAERELRTDEAIDHYRQSFEMDRSNGDAAFHLARLLELKGCDERALEIYEECLQTMPPNPALLMNLGILYEDTGEYGPAEACFRAVLKADPNNARARLYLGDVEASQTMHYDEDLERREDKRNATLRTPVTDFELSVRSRNCLAKMGIRTLGDLVQKTEAELLSYKNFGETSLMEIQQILHAKGLRLGMDQNEIVTGPFGGQRQPAGDLNDPRNRSITELELSVRSRRVVEMFKLRTIGDLCEKTEAELMACPNFGQTSLNEVKTKLDELGLGLKG